MIVDHLSAMTASIRFGGSSNKSLHEMTADLVPYPRLHFVAPSKAPHIELNDTVEAPTVDEMVEGVYDSTSHLLSIDLTEDKALCSTLTF